MQRYEKKHCKGKSHSKKTQPVSNAFLDEVTGSMDEAIPKGGKANDEGCKVGA
jgi:hypothetical protein